MKKLTDVEMARRELTMRVRAEANILRLRWLNEVLPAYLGEFDRRLQEGKPLELAAPSLDEFVSEAIKQAVEVE